MRDDNPMWLRNVNPMWWMYIPARRCGKQLTARYIAMYKLLEDHDLLDPDHPDPVAALQFLIENYQKVITKCTGGLLSKLTYTADEIISHILDEVDDIHND